MNPFITLTRIQNKGEIDINVNHIVCFQQKAFSDAPNKKYTYILVSGGSGCHREVVETPEEIREIINHAVLAIPYTHIKGA